MLTNLKAKNSTGNQFVNFTKARTGAERMGWKKSYYYWFTLFGSYKGEKIQIDFDTMSKRQVKKFIKQIKKKL